MNLPTDYDKLTPTQKRQVRNQYRELQKNKCLYCGGDLFMEPPTEIRSKLINWSLFPPGFLKTPIHLQHNHDSGLTEGAVHAYCNAVMWQYEGR